MSNHTYYIVMPFSRPQNIKFLADALYQCQEHTGSTLVWCPILASTSQISFPSVFPRIEPVVVPEPQKGTDFCYAKLNSFIQIHKVNPEGRYHFIADDDIYEPLFFNKLDNIEGNIIVNSLLRGHHMPPAALVPHTTNTVYAEPVAFLRGHVGMAMLTISGHLLPSIRFALDKTADTKLSLELFDKHKEIIKYAPDAFVKFNFLEPGRYDDAPTEVKARIIPINKPVLTKRIAIGLACHVRSYERTYTNLFKNIVEPLQHAGWAVDFYQHTWNTLSNPSASWHSDPTTNATNLALCRTPVDEAKLRSIYKHKALCIEPARSELKVRGWKLGPNPWSVMCAYESAKKCVNLILDSDIKYDKILMTRGDINYISRINPVELDSDKFLVSCHGQFLRKHSASDIWYIGTPAQVDISTNFIYELGSRLFKAGLSGQNVVHLEDTWHAWMVENNIPIAVSSLRFTVSRLYPTAIGLTEQRVDEYFQYHGGDGKPPVSSAPPSLPIQDAGMTGAALKAVIKAATRLGLVPTLLKDICLMAVRCHSVEKPLTKILIYLPKHAGLSQVLEQEGITISGRNYKYADVEIEIVHDLPPGFKTKAWDIYGMPVTVPFPVLGYLHNTFGARWNS